jgi:hypothetical protein
LPNPLHLEICRHEEARALKSFNLLIGVREEKLHEAQFCLLLVQRPAADSPLESGKQSAGERSRLE